MTEAKRDQYDKNEDASETIKEVHPPTDLNTHIDKSTIPEGGIIE